MTDDAVSRAMANSPTYLRLAAEQMQEDNVKDLAKAISPVVDALRDNATRLQGLVVAQRDSADGVKAALMQAIGDCRALFADVQRANARQEPPPPPEPVDITPIVTTLDKVCVALDRNTTTVLAAIQSLEVAVMAPVSLETTMGVPTGAVKTKKKGKS